MSENKVVPVTIRPYESFFTLQYTIYYGNTDVCHTDNTTRAELCQLAIAQFMESPAGRTWLKRHGAVEKSESKPQEFTD